MRATFRIISATFVVVLVSNACGGGESDPGAIFKTGSVWRGACAQSFPESSYPMVLFVKERKGDAFHGTAWYPSLGNALVKVSGRVDAKGAVTFTEETVLYGEDYGKDRRVVAGGRYTGRFEKAFLNGTGKWVDPRTGDATMLSFSLKLAD